MEAEELIFDSESRRLSLTGKGKAAQKADRHARAILDVFADGKPRSRNEITKDSPKNRNQTWKAITRLVEQGQLEEVGKGPNGYPLLLPSSAIEQA